MGESCSTGGVIAETDSSVQESSCNSGRGVTGQEVARTENGEKLLQRRRGFWFRGRLCAKSCYHGRAYLQQITQTHFAALVKQVDEGGPKVGGEATPQPRHDVCKRQERHDDSIPRQSAVPHSLSKHSVTTLLAHEQPRHVLLRIAVRCSGCFKHVHIMARTISSSDIPSERPCSMAESCKASFTSVM